MKLNDITVSEKKNISTLGRTTRICDQTNIGKSGTVYGESITSLIESHFLLLSTSIPWAYNFGNKRTCRQGLGPRYTLSTPPFLFLHKLSSLHTCQPYIYIFCSIKHALYIIYCEFYLGTCTKRVQKSLMGTNGTAYLIFVIRCNNTHIRILLHLILEIRYAVPYPCGPDLDVNTIGTNILRLL